MRGPTCPPDSLCLVGDDDVNTSGIVGLAQVASVRNRQQKTWWYIRFKCRVKLLHLYSKQHEVLGHQTRNPLACMQILYDCLSGHAACGFSTLLRGLLVACCSLC